MPEQDSFVNSTLSLQRKKEKKACQRGREEEGRE
jgi:hypothetical protein